MSRWKDWKQARYERKIYEALVVLSMMDMKENAACIVCDGNCELCICDEESECD